MKYFKILLIPLIALMFFVPVKADDEVPPWVNSGNYYVVTEYTPTGRLTAYILSSPSDMVYRRFGSLSGYYVPESNVIESWRTRNGKWVLDGGGDFADIDGVRHLAISFNHDDYAFRFSNFDIKSNGNLVFPVTPVTNLAMVTQKAVESLEMEVQGTSGKISLVGGVILGTLLVTHLISRLRYWVRV